MKGTVMIYEQQNYPECRHALSTRLNECSLSMHFGKVLKRARIESKFFTAEALSRAILHRCGVHHCARKIYRYESGRNSPSLDFLVAISLVHNPKIFSDLLTEVLSPGLVGEFEMRHAKALYDHSDQLTLFK